MTVHPQERKNKLNKYILVWNIGFYERCTRYNIRWSSLSVTCDRSVVFSGFLHQLNWPPQYDWNIVESSVRHHNSHPYTCTCISRKQLLLIFFIFAFTWYVQDSFFAAWCVWTDSNNCFCDMYGVKIQQDHLSFSRALHLSWCKIIHHLLKLFTKKNRMNIIQIFIYYLI
jgi:hypothetical protein